MATTVPKAFDEFAATIKPTPTQGQAITVRRGSVRRFLLAEYGPGSRMPLLDVTVIGSAGRKTLIRPVEDIDVFCVFERRHVWGSYRHDSKQLLYRVREALDGYSVKTVGSRGQAVRLFYNDGIYVDVTPAFRRRDFWGSDSGYIIPRGDGEWQPTDPYVHHQFIARRNEELGNNLKPLVRKLKRWNQSTAIASARFIWRCWCRRRSASSAAARHRRRASSSSTLGTTSMSKTRRAIAASSRLL